MLTRIEINNYSELEVNGLYESSIFLNYGNFKSKKHQIVIKKCHDLFETGSNKHEIHYTYLDCPSLVVPLSSGRSAMRFFINKAAGFTTELYRKT